MRCQGGTKRVRFVAENCNTDRLQLRDLEQRAIIFGNGISVE
jgi:hypothetical protein